jgi:hypothetical protein
LLGGTYDFHRAFAGRAVSCCIGDRADDAAIRAQAASPIAKQTKATVSRITLVGPSRARVVYTILIASVPTLKDVTRTAVRVGPAWKMSTKTYCDLQRLQGQPPPGLTDTQRIGRVAAITARSEISRE